MELFEPALNDGFLSEVLRITGGRATFREAARVREILDVITLRGQQISLFNTATMGSVACQIQRAV